MSDENTSVTETPGSQLNLLLGGFRTFLENAYTLMKFLETEVSRAGWALVRPNGYMITRNGTGRGLANFTRGDWTTTQMGIAFVKPEQISFKETLSNTPIPREGLPLLCYQVRWLDKAPDEPVVWLVRLLVEPEGEAKPAKWEDYQHPVFGQLKSASQTPSESSGDIAVGGVTAKKQRVMFSGTYAEVPVVQLQDREEVITALVDPATSKGNQAPA